MDAKKLNPTLEGIGILAASIVLIGFALASYSIGSNIFNIVTTLGLVGLLAGTLDGLGYIDASDYVDFDDFEQEQNQKSGKRMSEADDTPEKSKATPRKMRRELIMERAGMKCEMCSEPTRGAMEEVHHIKPRAEGGPNSYSNLIVLCPNCHSLADSGAIATDTLKHKTREQNRDFETTASD